MKKISIRDFYYNISIKTKLILIVFILIVCSIVIMGYFGYQSYAGIFREKSIDNLKKTVDEYSGNLSERMDGLMSLSEKVLTDDKIYELNSTYKDNLIHNKTLAESSFEINLNMYLRTYIMTRQFDLAVFRFNANKGIYRVSDDTYANNNYVFSEKNLTTSAKAGNGDPIWYLDIRNGKFKGIFLKRIILDRMSAEEIGTVFFKVKESYLFGSISKYLSQKVQNVGVYSDDTQLFYHNTLDAEFEEEASGLIRSSTPDIVNTVNFKGDTVYQICKTIQPVNWKLAVYISSNILLSDLKKVLLVTIIICLLTLPVWLLLINFIYRGIIKPINLLVDSMNKMEEGKTDSTVAIDRNDELGALFRTYNKMSQKINNLINKVYKEELIMKDAEIKALQAQINPHFLYNTLETINWKAKLNGVEDISEMVTALSSIIDANLDRNNEKMIPIKKELEYIDNYNLLIQKRFGKKIAFVKYIDDEALLYKIPKLLIQPLIENAIYHGLETKKGGGTVELIITIEEGTVLIVIADDGTGIDDVTLNKLKESLEKNDENQYESRTKIGIMNVHRRIRLIYGDEYGLKIFSEANMGTTIILKLPFSENRGAKSL